MSWIVLKWFLAILLISVALYLLIRTIVRFARQRGWIKKAKWKE